MDDKPEPISGYYPKNLDEVCAHLYSICQILRYQNKQAGKEIRHKDYSKDVLLPLSHISLKIFLLAPSLIVTLQINQL